MSLRTSELSFGASERSLGVAVPVLDAFDAPWESTAGRGRSASPARADPDTLPGARMDPALACHCPGEARPAGPLRSADQGCGGGGEFARRRAPPRGRLGRPTTMSGVPSLPRQPSPIPSISRGNARQGVILHACGSAQSHMPGLPTVKLSGTLLPDGGI